MVVTTVYFCFMPVQEKAKRKVNELKSIHLKRQRQDVLPSLFLTCPTVAQVMCLKSSLISVRAPCKQDEVREQRSLACVSIFKLD